MTDIYNIRKMSWSVVSSSSHVQIRSTYRELRGHGVANFGGLLENEYIPTFLITKVEAFSYITYDKYFPDSDLFWKEEL